MTSRYVARRYMTILFVFTRKPKIPPFFQVHNFTIARSHILNHYEILSYVVLQVVTFCTVLSYVDEKSEKVSQLLFSAYIVSLCMSTLLVSYPNDGRLVLEIDPRVSLSWFGTGTSRCPCSDVAI